MDGPPLQSLQQLIQWVGDFVLYLLANLPNQVRSACSHRLWLICRTEGSDGSALSQGSMVRPGFGFMRDGASLGMLREMLVMIRIWGLLKPGCLPTFTATSDNQDSMQLLFRLLTKLWLCCKTRTRTRTTYRLFIKPEPHLNSHQFSVSQPGMTAPPRTLMRAS